MGINGFTGTKRVINVRYEFNFFYLQDLTVQTEMIIAATACVRLMLDKVGVDGFTGPQQEVVVRYEFDFLVHLKDIRMQKEISATII